MSTSPRPPHDSRQIRADGAVRPASGLSRGPAEAGELPVADPTGPTGAAPAIRSFEKARRHEEEWNRTPNTTGRGAIHVRTFHCKLTDDALQYLDQMVNEWLDAHPQYEVKFVTTTVGTMTGKIKEPHLICQVWV